MNGLTDYITEQPWVDTITAWYVLVDDAYQRVLAQRGCPWRSRGPAPHFSDSEVITLSLVIETFFQGHEDIGYAFIAQYHRALFPKLIAPERFNERRRALIAVIEAIRCELRDHILDRADPIRLVDSAPVTLMTYMRGSRCRSFIGNQYFGVVTTKRAKFFGLRLHATVTAKQLIDEWLLAPAAARDNQVLDALVQDSRDLVLIGDKGYVDADLADHLWDRHRIQLLALRRANQYDQWPKDIRKILGRVRHGVETVFSTLATVFNLQQPRGRSVAGHVVRVATCILAHTLSFFLA